MKTAFLTDLHANREAVEAVLADARRRGFDRIALLGDFVGYGPDPGWVVDLARELVAEGAVAVLGNHDAAVVEGPRPTMRADVMEVVAWTRAQLDPAQLAVLAGLPLTQTRGDVLHTHANAWEPGGWAYVEGREEAARSLRATACRLTFCGHIHQPRLYHLSGTGKVADFVPTAGVAVPLLANRRWLVIPGAVGQPRDGNPAACYAIHDDAQSTVTFLRVPYDHDATRARMRALGLPDAFADRLARGQ
jgi:diadenosine tetraphosphatase ApaH/serine/threonine PP2A family protein phosphatase